MKPVSANGVEGILINTFEGIVFRVYGADHTFIDYDLHHSDLCVTINDADAYFYSGDNIDRIDHSPETLGFSELIKSQFDIKEN